MKLEKIERGRFAAAKIVEKLGTEYLIFFERLENEYNKAVKKFELQNVALNLAKTKR